MDVPAKALIAGSFRAPLKRRKSVQGSDNGPLSLPPAMAFVPLTRRHHVHPSLWLYMSSSGDRWAHRRNRTAVRVRLGRHVGRLRLAARSAGLRASPPAAVITLCDPPSMVGARIPAPLLGQTVGEASNQRVVGTKGRSNKLDDHVPGTHQERQMSEFAARAIVHTHARFLGGRRCNRDWSRRIGAGRRKCLAFMACKRSAVRARLAPPGQPYNSNNLKRDFERLVALPGRR